MRADEVLRLYFKERPGLEAFLLSATRDYGATQDLLQEVALVLARKCESYDPALPFRPWLNGIARIELAGWRKDRGASFRALDPETLEACMPAFQEMVDDAGLRNRRNALQECLKSVPQESRRVLDLRYVHQRSCEETAQALRRSVQGVYALLKRAKAALRECVESRLKEAAL